MLSPAGPSRANPRLVVPVLVLAVVSFALIQSLIAPVLPVIQHDLHTTQSAVTWVLTANLLSAAVFTPIVGRLGDRTGKGRMLLVTLLALAVGSAISAVAPNIGVMLVGRMIQGVGGGVMPLAFGIVRDQVPRDRVARVVGLLAALLGVGSGLALVVAGPIADALNYRALFWLPMLVVVMAAVATYVLIPSSGPRAPGRFSWTASVLLAGWLICLLVPLTQASVWGWTSARVLFLLLAAVVLAAAWIVIETRSASPLIDMRMMRLKAVWTTNLLALLVGLPMYANMGFLPGFVQTSPAAGYGFGFGATVTRTGLLIVPLSVTMFLCGLVAPRLSHRFGPKTVLVAGSVFATGAFVILTLAHRQQWEIMLSMALLGLGLGLSFATMSNVIVAAVPAHQTGVANGMNANIRTIGGAIGAALMASIVGAHTLPSGLPKESGYAYGFAMLAAVSVAGTLAAFLVPRHRQHDPAPALATRDEEDYAEAAIAGVPGLDLDPVSEAA